MQNQNLARILYVQEKNEKNQLEDKIIYAEKNKTILQISLENQIPHVHACGGNAKCSTCRIMVISGEENLSPPEELEKQLSLKKGFHKKIRLACQTKVWGDIKIKRLVRDEIDEELAISNNFTGRELSIAILFADIRNFTNFSEKHLAYDVVHILNRFYKKMGDAILNYEGYIDKFMGDGILALFGINDKNNQKKCQNALFSAIEMLDYLQEINVYLKQNFGEEFRIGIGLHFGTAIIGELGHPEKKQTTAIGDSINFTSRLEKLTKKIKSPILVSEEFKKILNIEEYIEKEYIVSIRGKTGYYKIYSIKKEKNIISLRSLIKSNMSKTIAPSILRLVFHDIMSGGSITSNMNDEYNLSLELQKKENQNLENAVNFIKSIKNKIEQEPYTYRDILYLSGAVAVEITNGPYINIIVPTFSDKLFVEIGIPDSEENLSSFYKKFLQLGLNKIEMVALIGAHTLGKENNKPFTENPFEFNNEYFKRLINYKEDPTLSKLLKSDWELLQDTECKEYVTKFALNKESFFEEFKKAYIKMIHFAK